MELLLAGIDPQEATVSRFLALASTHRDWREDAGMEVVLNLVERGMAGEGVPKESLWVFRISGTFAPPNPTFKDYLNSDILGAHQAEAHASQAVYWLVSLMRSTAPSGAWHRVGVGLTKATETNSGALESALELLPSEASLGSIVRRQLPIAKIIGIYNELSQRVF
ncbi:MAG: hypothetical protein MUF33_01905 [Candidatus Nanopelagicales bacterium]|jgi:hypothetical protein|nr:hypothetical protein [Candidatus Nanopelagicales bacterium]MCU0297256.1 hypothetical protein [Candidatus Nanopelagicales bacterium]